MKHVFAAYNSGIDPQDDPFHPFTPDEWSQQSSTMLRTYLIQNLPDPHGPEPVPSGPISSSRPTGYSATAIELMGFKKGIKREIVAYLSLKDERYFDGFKRSLLIVAKTHECNEVLDPTYTPGSEPEKQELFEAKQTFMFSVFNASLQTDMGKTIVRRHLANTDAQLVWKELSEHMRTSSKGASEKRRLTQYVTNTVLDDLKVLLNSLSFISMNNLGNQRKSLRTMRSFHLLCSLPSCKLLSGASTILGLLKLWMSSKAPPMDMDPPLPCPIKPTMIYSSMPVLGMIRLKRPIWVKEEMSITQIYIIPMLIILLPALTMYQTHPMKE